MENVRVNLEKSRIFDLKKKYFKNGIFDDIRI